MPAEASPAGAGSADIGSIGIAGATGDTLTEDAILDAPSESAPAVAEPEVVDTPAVDAPADAGKPATEQPEKADAAAAADNLPSSLPKELTALLKDPSVAPKIQAVMPQIQSAFDQLARIREVFPTTRAVHEFAEAFPGGIEEAKAAQQKATILDAADEEFSGTPDTQRALAEEWASDNPEAFASMFVQSAQVLQQRNPEAYARITEQVFLGRLAQIGFDEQIEGFRQVLASNNVDKMKGMVAWMVQEADKLGIKWKGETGKTDPELSAAQREREAAKSDLSAANAERIEIFKGQVGASVGTTVTQSIAAVVNPLLKDAPFSDAGKTKISSQIRDEIDVAIKADKGMQRQIARILSEGLRTRKMDDARKQVVGLLSSRAKQLIPKTAKRVIEERTSEFVAGNNALNLRRDAAGKRTDVGTGGAPPAVRTRKLTKEDAATMSDDDIMNA